MFCLFGVFFFPQIIDKFPHCLIYIGYYKITPSLIKCDAICKPISNSQEMLHSGADIHSTLLGIYLGNEICRL